MARKLSKRSVDDLRGVLRQQIAQCLEADDVQEALRQCVDEVASDASGDCVDNERLLRALDERGLVSDVLQRSLANRSPVKGQSRGARQRPEELHLQLLGGRAFVNELADQEEATFLTLHTFFAGQRHSSKPVPCACEPQLHELFVFPLLAFKTEDKKVTQPRTSGGSLSVAADLVMLSEPICLFLIKECPASGQRSLLSSHRLEWRQVLSASRGRLTLCLELNGILSEAKVPVGLLEVCLELKPRLREAMSAEVFSAQLALERSRRSECERRFLVYAKQWWQQYLAIRPSHSARMVKLFAQDENGFSRMVCSVVKPLQADRVLDTPRQAAHFVSLLPYARTPSLGGGQRVECWASMGAFLSKCAGDCEEHSVLLCSLLLGFGLDAYVCIGTNKMGASHTWVVTFNTEPPVTTFWESLSGQRCNHNSKSVGHNYQTVGCVFNHKQFFANIQPTDSVADCVWDLSDHFSWKGMGEGALSAIVEVGGDAATMQTAFPILRPPQLDGVAISKQLEDALRHTTWEHRRQLGLPTHWDNKLCYLLSQALAAYELECCTGISAGNEEFQSALRRHVAEGHTFKGFPIQFVHFNAAAIFANCLRSTVCRDIISCQGDEVFLAVRAKVFPYPEGCSSVWIMFAVHYRSIL